MRAIAAGLSDVGLQRAHNEDSYIVLKEYDLFVVADGMGGHRAGDVASKLGHQAVRLPGLVRCGLMPRQRRHFTQDRRGGRGDAAAADQLN